MSKIAGSIAALVVSLSTLSLHAAPPDPSAGLLWPPMHPPVPGPAAQSVVQGEVQRMMTNPYGEVDGLRLMDGTIVKFPPHKADSLTAALKTGDAVRIIGRPEARGTVKADAVINSATGQMVYDQPPPIGEGRPLPAHLRTQRLQPQQVQGRVDAVLTSPLGETNGVILTDGSIVRFPPENLRLPVQPGAPFAAAGLGTRNTFGTSLEAVSMGTSLSTLQPLYNREP